MNKPRQKNLEALLLFGSVIVGGLYSPPGTAAQASHGELAAAIRSAQYPCAHVLNVDSIGNNAWIVECNSGSFSVSRDQDGNFEVAPKN